MPSSLPEIYGTVDSSLAVAARAARDAANAARDIVVPLATQVDGDAQAVEISRANVQANQLLVQDDRILAQQAAADAVPAANTATTKAAEAGAARDTAVAAVATGRVRKATLAELNTALNYPADAVGEVDQDGLNNGQYTKVGASGTGSWTRTSTATVNSLAAIVSAEADPLNDQVQFRRAMPAGGFEVIGGIRDQGREFYAAGARWIYNAGTATSRWRRGAGGPVAELDAVGLRTDGALGFGASANMLREGPDITGILHAHRLNDYLVYWYGQREHFAAGMLNVLRADGSRVIDDKQPTPLVSVTPTGVTTWRGALRGAEDGLTTGPLIAVRDGSGNVAGFRVDPSDYALRLEGRVNPNRSNPVDARLFGLKGDGSDESAALKSAHDAAVALGIRALDLGTMAITAPTALYLGNVMLLGQKQLIGTYRKRVIPPAAPSIHLRSDVIPSRHLTAFAAAASPVVVALGDSTMFAAEATHQTLGLWGALQRKLVRDNRHKSIAFHNRAIPGTNWATWDTTIAAENMQPAWYTDRARAYLLYLSDLAPDLIIIEGGENDGSTSLLAPMVSVMAKLLAFPKVPDIIICNNLVPTLQDPAYGDKANQERRDRVAGMERTYAIRNGHGLIDMHRNFCAVRDGFDVLDQPTERVADSGTVNLPYIFPRECSDYVFDFQQAGGFDAMVAGGQVVVIPLSFSAANAIKLRKSGGFWQIKIQASDARVQLDWTSTGIASVTRIAGSIRSDGYCTVEFNSASNWAVAPVWSGYVERFGGLFTPRIGLEGDDTPFSCTLIRVAVGVPRIVAPSLTDQEVWGIDPVGENMDGNPPNHVSAKGAAIYDQAVRATNFVT